jgi:2-phosphosulfolactate phosphatase
MKTLEVLFTPADFAALDRRNLDRTICVVFDVFRATSSMITALANGASAVIPVGEIAEALEIRKRDPQVLLIRAELTGGTDFDLGNSPIEFTREKVAGKTIVMTTTNGTRALRACAHAKDVLVSSFLNLKATADWITRERPENLLLVCSGTFEQTAYEDVLGAGALCDTLWDECSKGEISDSALMARRLYQLGRKDLADVAASSRNGRRLQSRASLKDDVLFCLRQNAEGRARAEIAGRMIVRGIPDPRPARRIGVRRSGQPAFCSA